MLILVFSVRLDWLPIVYRADLSATGLAWLWEQIKQSIMPVTVLGLFQGGVAGALRALGRARRGAARLCHDGAFQGHRRAQGDPSPRGAHRAHPVVTLVALQLPIVFGGAIVTEQIFRVPGIGSLLISAMLANDTPVVMAVTFVFACLVVVFNLIADILYGWLDPRISYR